MHPSARILINYSIVGAYAGAKIGNDAMGLMGFYLGWWMGVAVGFTAGIVRALLSQSITYRLLR